ncbi:hypothetical protein OG562_11390 [Streptomyces sp. NBC_01275]|nr:hypothetical protein [Streptomyces sp. NBC_01275]
MAEPHGDMNVLHPFREGNGRAQRAFPAQPGHDAGYDLSWSGMDPQRNEDASVKSFLGDNSLSELSATRPVRISVPVRYGIKYQSGRGCASWPSPQARRAGTFSP